ncbi:MAG: sulfatase [Paludibacter sp.]|jgi:N-sulfoglucosamine sulfohydrolase|nr:sulfatase [Paludibacter sp.]
MNKSGTFISLLAISSTPFYANKPATPNILLITVDDMNYNSIGAYGSPVKNITPHIDKLASAGIRFERAFVQCAVSMPSRNVLATGMYPHRSGLEGFNYIPENSPVKSVFEILQERGYYTGCMAKLPHCFPKMSGEHNINCAIKSEELNQGREPKLFYQKTKEFLEEAKKNKQAFYLMCNSQDPHRPFYDSDDVKSGKKGGNFFGDQGEPQPSRIYTESEVNIPAFLPDLPDIRKEITQYYNNVKRADDIVGEVLKALSESGMEENTVVFFLSDNGMAFPFSKTNVYLNSNRTPLIVKWPGQIKPGQVEKDAFIGGIDFLPTVLEIADIKPPYQLDGKSYLNRLKGKPYTVQNEVYTLFFANSAFKAYPMRCLQNKHFAYIFSPWANDGDYQFTSETKVGLTYKAMKAASKMNPAIADRLRLFDFRVTEEFYDLSEDPDALVNLIDNPAYKNQIEQFRKSMEQKMTATNDHILDAFRNRNNNEKQREYVQLMQTRATDQRKLSKKGE